jgi:membrane-bound lytic murein transglycosylase C
MKKYREGTMRSIKDVLFTILSCFLFLAVANPIFASDEDFQSFVKQEKEQFSSFIDEQEKDYAAYQAEVRSKWGEFIGSSKKVWVDYGADKESRSQVDFKSGKISLEVLIPENEKNPRQAASEKIKRQLKRMMSDRWPTGKNLLTGQISVDGKKDLSPENVDKFVQERLKEKLKTSSKLIPQPSAPPKRVVSVEVQMVPEHLKIRADRYKPIVLKYCKQRNIDPSIVFGLIHTESYFNPMARSHVPAYGLMQLVPVSGGRDAYKHLYNEDKKPSAEFLYNPENNINLGVAYLDLTKNVYFAGIENPGIAYLLTVAAYNTGAGNVARALTGKTDLKPAVKKAQSMTTEDIHMALRKKLPYKETQDYIQRVFSRSKIYRGL